MQLTDQVAQSSAGSALLGYSCGHVMSRPHERPVL